MVIIVIGPFYTTPLLFYSCFLYLTFACLGDLMTARVIVEDPYIIIMDLFHQKRSPIQMMVWMPMDSLHLEAVVSNIFFYRGILQKTIRLRMHVLLSPSLAAATVPFGP